MSEGKFSQPRPHRDEERQIEESFRQLTEDKNRRKKKTYNVEEEISRTVQDIAAQQESQPREHMLPFERSAKLEETVQVAVGQDPASLLPKDMPEAVPPKPALNHSAIPRPYADGKNPEPVSQEPELNFPLTEKMPRKNPFLPEDPVFTEEIPAEEEPDFLDKMMKLGSFFQKHQTPVILGLCGAALLLIVLFVSIFFSGRGSQEQTVTQAGNVLIAGVNINGMTKEQAIDAVTQAADAAYLQKDMVVDFGTAQLTLSPKDTDAQLDVRAAVDAAFALPPAQEQQYIALLPYLRLNTDYIHKALSTFAEDTGSTLTQTSYGLEGSEPVLSADGFNEKAPTQTLIIVMGTPGIGFDVKDVYEKVLDAYSLHTFLVEVENVESVTQPEPIDLDAIYKEFYIAPVNASVNLQNFQTKPGSYGYGFDLEQTRKLVEKAQPGEVLRIPMEYIAPEILDNDAFFKDILGQHQTRGSNHDGRNNNLQLACEALNGTVLNPGESLSFSSKLGNVGNYYMAPEDSGQEEIPQGGVSQVASTLYYAVLLSDLNVSSRSNHTYLPSFIDYGLDATAALSFTNTTGYPIQINAQYTGGYVKIEILGTEERTHYVMLESSISNSTVPETVYELYPYNNIEGYEDGDVIEEGSAGYLVKSYKVKYDRKTGRELSRDFLTNSQYPAVDKVVARVEEPPTEPPTQPPTEAPYIPPETLPPATVPPVTVPPTEAPELPPETVPATEAPIAEIPPEVPSDTVTQ